MKEKDSEEKSKYISILWTYYLTILILLQLKSQHRYNAFNPEPEFGFLTSHLIILPTDYLVSVILQIVLPWKVLGDPNISSDLRTSYTTPPSLQHMLIIQRIL